MPPFLFDRKKKCSKIWEQKVFSDNKFTPPEITVILDKQKMRFYNISKVKGVDEDSNLPMERSREPGRVGAGTSTGKEKITSEPLR